MNTSTLTTDDARIRLMPDGTARRSNALAQIARLGAGAGTVPLPTPAATPRGTPLVDVARQGNSYSGMNVTGPITINGRTPGGAVTPQPGSLAATAMGDASGSTDAGPGDPVTGARPLSALATQAQARAVDNSPANSAAIAAAPLSASPPAASPSTTPAPATPPAPTPLSDVARQGNSYSGGNVSGPITVNGQAPGGSYTESLGTQAAGAGRPLSALATPNADAVIAASTRLNQGAGVIDGAGGDARQKFFDEANLRNAAAQGSWSPRRGYQGNDAAVGAAAIPLVNRARQDLANTEAGASLQRTAMEQSGADNRAALAERAADARFGITDARNQEQMGLARQRLDLETQREDRQLTASLAEQARAGRLAAVDTAILSGTPEEQKQAAAQKAALMGKGLDAAGKVGEVSTAIRKEFEGLPEVKNYKQALPAFRGIEDAVKRNTPMSDINLVYGIAKLYDPNSVVREGEYGTVANAPGMPERIKGWVSYVQGGGKLTPEVKQQILTEGTSRMQTFDKEYGAAINRYGDIASRSGADASLVVPQGYQPLPTQQPAEAPQLAELRRRAATNPQLAERLRAAGY